MIRAPLRPRSPVCANDFLRVLTAEPMAVRRVLIDLRATAWPSCSEDILDRLELALAEVLNNIAEHGRPQGGIAARPGGLRIHLAVRPREDGLCCVVWDDGAPPPPGCFELRERKPSACPDPANLPEGGFGLCMLRDLVGPLAFTRLPRRNLLAFHLPNDAEAA